VSSQQNLINLETSFFERRKHGVGKDTGVCCIDISTENCFSRLLAVSNSYVLFFRQKRLLLFSAFKIFRLLTNT
jgi:hypothetical protein